MTTHPNNALANAGYPTPVIGTGFYRNAPPGTFGPSEWLDLLMACQDGRATCLRVMEYIERETVPVRLTKSPDDLLEAMTNAFLRCPLPATVSSDLCVTTPDAKHRSGTNLLTYPEAEEMLRAVVLPLLSAPSPAQATDEAAVRQAAEQAHTNFVAKGIDGQDMINAFVGAFRPLFASLRERAERAEKERDIARSEHIRFRDGFAKETVRTSDLTKEISILRCRCEEPEKDKARLDWLENNLASIHRGTTPDMGGRDWTLRPLGVGNPNKYIRERFVRSAIDAAMAQAGGTKQP